MITLPVYLPAIACIAYASPDGGVGSESRMLVDEWRESVYPHIIAPISRLPSASTPSAEWEWSDSATLVAEKSQAYPAVVTSERPFVFTSFFGEFDFDDDDAGEG